MRARTAYEKGKSACRRGKRMSDNPYTHETSRQSYNFRCWMEGYAIQARQEADEMRAKQQEAE